MKKMTKRKEAFDPLTVDASYFLGQSEEIRALLDSIFAKIKQVQSHNVQVERGATKDVEDLAQLFENGENRGKVNEQKAQMWKMWQWWFWYFKSCLRIIFSSWRHMERDRKSTGAYVMHLIVNDLLATEGISALAVIAALAGKARKSRLLLRKLTGRRASPLPNPHYAYIFQEAVGDKHGSRGKSSGQADSSSTRLPHTPGGRLGQRRHQTQVQSPISKIVKGGLLIAKKP